MPAPPIAYMTPTTLAALFTTPSDTTSSGPTLPASTAIIDVRDADHIGGHIKGSMWIPSSTLDYRLPELARLCEGKDTVVFHCALSQVRGPGAAGRYVEFLRGRDGDGKDGEEGKEGGKKQKQKQKQKQKVYVLEGGFTKWQERYGEDERLTEGYQKDIWELGY